MARYRIKNFIYSFFSLLFFCKSGWHDPRGYWHSIEFALVDLLWFLKSLVPIMKFVFIFLFLLIFKFSSIISVRVKTEILIRLSLQIIMYQESGTKEGSAFGSTSRKCHRVRTLLVLNSDFTGVWKWNIEKIVEIRTWLLPIESSELKMGKNSRILNEI